MSMGPIHCLLGFSMNRSNDFSEQLERRAGAMEASFRDSFFRLQLGISRLHDSIDAALAGEDANAAERLSAGLGELAASPSVAADECSAPATINPRTVATAP